MAADPRLENHPVLLREAERLGTELYVTSSLGEEVKGALVAAFAELLADPARPETRHALARIGLRRNLEIRFAQADRLGWPPERLEAAVSAIRVGWLGLESKNRQVELVDAFLKLFPWQAPGSRLQAPGEQSSEEGVANRSGHSTADWRMLPMDNPVQYRLFHHWRGQPAPWNELAGAVQNGGIPIDLRAWYQEFARVGGVGVWTDEIVGLQVETERWLEGLPACEAPVDGEAAFGMDP